MKEHHKNILILIIVLTIIAIILSLLSHGDEPNNYDAFLPLIPLAFSKRLMRSTD